MPAIHAKLSTLASGVTLASPSPMAKVLWHHNGDGEKVIVYLGFKDPVLAKTCYDFLSTQVGRYRKGTDLAGRVAARHKNDLAWNDQAQEWFLGKRPQESGSKPARWTSGT